MALAIKKLDAFLDEEVREGHCESVKDAEKQVLAQLLERDIDRCIERGREDFANGHFTEANEKSNAAFVAELTKKLGFEVVRTN
jgi:hypothetical protein